MGRRAQYELRIRTGQVAIVYPNEDAMRIGVTQGDRVLDLPQGNVSVGYRIHFKPKPSVHVLTQRGVVAVYPGLYREPIGSAPRRRLSSS